MNRVHPVSFLLATTDHGPLITSRFDYHEIGPNEAYGVGAQLLNSGAYDPGEIAIVKALLSYLHQKRPDENIIALDCGANIGVHVVEMARHMRDWGTVLAFEPQERLYYALCGNIALHNAWNAAARMAAVGSTDGRIKIPRPNYNAAGSYGSLELVHSDGVEFIGQSIDYNDNNMNEIPLIKIDTLALPPVAFMKIDVEGMESDVLVGALNTIKSGQPILLVEWIKSGKEAIQTQLEPLNYRFEEMGGNLLCKPKED